MLYFFTGMPLAGKGWYSRLLAGDLGLPRLSTGDLARSMGMGLEPSISTLDLSLSLDGAVMEAVALFATATGGSGVIDGFPRGAHQYAEMVRWGYPFRVIFMTVNPVVAFRRLLDRARLEGRPEDTEGVVEARIRRSVEWRQELKSLMGGLFVEADESTGYAAIKGALGC